MLPWIGETKMLLVDAIELVLELARQNLAPDEPETSNERKRQLEACATLEDFATNWLGDN